MEATKHRRAQIIDALAELFEILKEDPKESGFPVQVKTVQRRFIHWTTLDQQGAIPSLLLSYGDGRRKRRGGENAKYASLGETEEYLPFALIAVLKETSETSKPITDQVSDMIYAVEKLVNGSRDLGVEGVLNTEVLGDNSSAGEISALEGTPFEVVPFLIIVTHVYRSTTAV